MVEQQCCASSLVTASASCGHEVKEESNVNVNAIAIAEISAELQRERQKNAELMQRVSLLEAQLQHTNDQLIRLQVSSPSGKQRRFRKFKKQKSETSTEKVKDQRIEMASWTLNMPSKGTDLENCLVNWMSMDDYQFFECEKLKYGDSLVDCDDDTDETDDEINEDLDENDMYHMEKEDVGNVKSVNEMKELPEHDDKDTNVPCLENSSVCHGKPIVSNEIFSRGRLLNVDIFPAYDEGEIEKYDNCEIFTSRQEFKGCGSGRGNILLQKKSSKVAFCPKEIRRIIKLEELLLENAHSHTIRKIIVFASLGIRHGSEEMYELDFNHFRILQKGEPYLSSKNPGEHVVYENPGIRRKCFYPNRKNPTLCPVRILEEEEGMRPSDAGCPSFLFLCIKYGGSTRNLPQNEYVRQRMGRNKLKSFGPLICRMAMLAHIRSGSFFFKALGITLLFMAGFPDDQVRKETKYRNLDLLQKYYRSDEDAEGEELFLSYPTASDSHQLPGKTFLKKAKGKKRKSPITKLHDSTKLAKNPESAPSTSSPPTKQFGLMGYASIQAQTMMSIQSMAPQIPITSRPVSHPNISYTNQSSYPNFPPHLPNSYLPMVYWPPSTAPFQHCYPYSYNYRTFPSTGNYFPIHPHPLYSHASSNPLIPRIVKGIEKNNSDSNSSSSSTEPKDN